MFSLIHIDLQERKKEKRKKESKQIIYTYHKNYIIHKMTKTKKKAKEGETE